MGTTQEEPPMSHNISLPRHRYVYVIPSFVLRDLWNTYRRNRQ